MASAKHLLILALICTTIGTVNCGNVLVLLTQASQSHKNVFEPIIQGLADRNHTLTVASAYQGKSRKNVREIVPNNFAAAIKSAFGNPFEMRSRSRVGILTSNFDFMFKACHETYNNKEFRALEKEKFDLIFVDAVFNECLYGFIHKLAAPFILVCPMAAPSSITESVGNRQPASFVPVPMLPFSHHMSFFQRLTNVAFILLWEFAREFILRSRIETTYRQYLGEDLPGFHEISQNASMIFMNSHFAFTFPRPLLPDVVEVGGMHCRPAKPLPKDLEDFVSGAKGGLILFSLGSIVEGKDMPDEVRQKFLNVFSRLKQRVLWKWETGEMAGLPTNVRVSRWLPQQDILGHPNTKLFITHGGLLSTLEATYHGVPLIGVPIFGDQDLNMAQAERAGYALTIEILNMAEEKLENAINQILHEKQYTEKVKYLSSIYRDQMNTPLERALYWSEYVMRHQGAPQLRSAARNLNFFQYYCLDVTAALIAILVTLMWVFKLIIVGLFRCVFRTKDTKSSKKNN